MLNNLLFFLLFETMDPSYGFLSVIVPEQIVLAAEIPNAIVKRGDSIAPLIQAKSIYSIDLTTGTPLLVRDVFSRRPIASITKLMTAIVILDSHGLEEVVTVSKNASNQEGSRMGLVTGEKMTVENLLFGLLINSGNDAAVALAEFHAGSESKFANKLNAKANALGLHNTHLSNAKGFDDEYNYSTAFDTMHFAKVALTYPIISKIVKTRTAEVQSIDGKYTHKLSSTNEMLKDENFEILGIKTGTTPEAGQSFVSLFKSKDGHEILTVLLSSPNRFKETKIVLDWILRNYEF